MSWPFVDPDTGLPVELKQPGESKTLPFDFAAQLRDTPIVSVSSVATGKFNRVVGSTELTVVGYELDPAGGAVDVTLSGGTEEEAYKVTVTVVDQDGDVHELDTCVYVIEG